MSQRVGPQIARLGFRRWYERQLVESHSYLVAGFLALILLLAGFEMLDDRTWAGYAVLVTVAAAAGVGCLVAWRRFTVLLTRAEQFAEQAACPGCQSWGRFDVIAEEASGRDDPPEAGRPHWLRVRCKRCQQHWTLG